MLRGFTVRTLRYGAAEVVVLRPSRRAFPTLTSSR